MTLRSTRTAVRKREVARYKAWRAVQRKAKAAYKLYSTSRARRKGLDKRIAAAQPVLRERAYTKAAALVGVMEQGGNNVGPTVTKIIRANGGGSPEPWCGDFVAYVYRLAGSKAVNRSWAAVVLLGNVAGVRSTKSPKRGDIVRFDFPGGTWGDHVGLFVRRVDAHTIETIEGNTGSSGAVSDSSTGGDGIYRKRRSTSQVHDYLHVSR